jgi:hypothetical protein
MATATQQNGPHDLACYWPLDNHLMVIAPFRPDLPPLVVQPTPQFLELRAKILIVDA